MRVLIIGAGLGGVCLAHGLIRAGIDVQLFERNLSSADQPASYGIHLNAHGLRALHACLPAENWQHLVSAAIPARDIIRFWDPSLRLLAVHDRETPENASDPITRRRGVSRDALRDALLVGLNREARNDSDVIQWGKTFTRYESGSGGKVHVHFADDSEAIGDLLVGADGSNSRVRKQRLPELERIELGISNIAGRLPLTAELASHLPPTLIDGSVNNLVPSGPGWMFVSTWRADQATADARYLIWAWVGSQSSYPAQLDQLSSTQLRDHVLARIADWAPEIRSAVANTDPSTVARVPLRTMPQLGTWPSNQVTLLGDAIHNMTPMAGIGANTALRDADELRRALTDDPAVDVAQRVANYERAMRQYANDALHQSTRNARSAATESRAPRLAFRALLRVAEAVPYAKALIFRA